MSERELAELALRYFAFKGQPSPANGINQPPMARRSMSKEEYEEKLAEINRLKGLYGALDADKRRELDRHEKELRDRYFNG
jgi:hypothetical protein